MGNDNSVKVFSRTWWRNEQRREAALKEAGGSETGFIEEDGLSPYSSTDAYSAGDTVSKDGGIFMANEDIPAGTDFEEGASGATWVSIVSSLITLDDFQPDFPYKAKYPIVRDGNIFRSKEATKELSWVPEHWELLGSVEAFFSNVPTGHLPVMDAAGEMVDSGIVIGTDKITTEKSFQVGLSTILFGLGESHTHEMSANGQNISFVNKATGLSFTPGGWSFCTMGEEWKSLNRAGLETYNFYVVTSKEDAAVLNPRFESPVNANRRDYALFFKSLSAVNSVTITVYSGEIPIFKSREQDFEVGLNEIDLTPASEGQGFLDLHDGELYTFEVTSTEGDVRLAGGSYETSAGVFTDKPWFAIKWQRWIDLEQANIVDVEAMIETSEAGLVSPSFLAVNSIDKDIVYGGFKLTGRIRKRVLSTGLDSFFTSEVTLPITDHETWSDWQDRETITVWEES